VTYRPPMDDESLDALAHCDGQGRNVLEARLHLLVDLIKSTFRDNAQLTEQLTVVQMRCTSLLAELRATTETQTDLAAVGGEEEDSHT